MKKILELLAASGVLCLAGQAMAVDTDLILNEWNAVGPSQWLEDEECDPAFSSCSPWDNNDAQGNGHDWLELVVIKDGLDLTGYSIEWGNDDISCGGTSGGTLTFKEDDLWHLNGLPAGTIITIRTIPMCLASNLNFDPCSNPGGDWHIEISADDTDLITQSGTPFYTDNDGWHAKVLNASSQVMNWAGEDGSGATYETGSGINSQEVGKLEGNPPANPAGTVPNSYNDGNCSSYGQPNCWSGGSQTSAIQSLRSGADTTAFCP